MLCDHEIQNIIFIYHNSLDLVTFAKTMLERMEKLNVGTTLAGQLLTLFNTHLGHFQTRAPAVRSGGCALL